MWSGEVIRTLTMSGTEILNVIWANSRPVQAMAAAFLQVATLSEYSRRTFENWWDRRMLDDHTAKLESDALAMVPRLEGDVGLTREQVTEVKEVICRVLRHFRGLYYGISESNVIEQEMSVLSSRTRDVAAGETISMYLTTINRAVSYTHLTLPTNREV